MYVFYVPKLSFDDSHHCGRVMSSSFLDSQPGILLIWHFEGAVTGEVGIGADEDVPVDQWFERLRMRKNYYEVTFARWMGSPQGQRGW
jgi:hypothetical protein